MIKVAKEFFDHHSFSLDSSEDFFDTDLAKYFELLYKTKLKFSNSGFIKVIRKNNKVYFYENVFYDWANQPTAEYITFEGVDIKFGEIRNTREGKMLSENGYYLFRNAPEYTQTLSSLPSLNYDEEGCERKTEPFRTHKFHPQAWGEPVNVDSISLDLYNKVRKNIQSLVSFSPILRSLDAFDMIGLEWRDGRSILPHNDLDFRMMVNLVSYNTKDSKGSRPLKVGVYDWYDYTFHSLVTEDWEMTNNITADKTQIDTIEPSMRHSIMVNVFNPKFYHEVCQMDGEGVLYSAPSHLGFRKIVDNFRLKR